MVNVVWAATSTASGRFVSTERRSSLNEVSERFDQLRADGQGYLEVRMPDRDFPVLALGFRKGRAVIHLMQDPDQISLLTGGGSVPRESLVEIQAMDDLVEFTGDFVLGIDSACTLVQEFLRTGETTELGEWRDL